MGILMVQDLKLFELNDCKKGIVHNCCSDL